MTIDAGRIGAMCAIAIAVIGATLGLSAERAAAQQAGVLRGTVVSETGAPLPGVIVAVEPTTAGAITDVRGGFRMEGLPLGRLSVTASRLGYVTWQTDISVSGRVEQSLDIVLEQDALALSGIVVSVSREAQRLVQTPASISVVSGERIRSMGVSHPGELMRQVPGAWVNVTAGEGHQTAIRQPLTTSPMYLYLEDGIPTRSTGFFNHNALYEVNVPQADRVEVTKGPVTALYGSDAIGGIVNVGTRAPSTTPGLEASAEAGSFGWQRLLLSGSNSFGEHGVRAELNLTRSDGWRTATGYDRQSGTVRWDGLVGGGSVRTVATFSRVDQSTAGSSALREDDYLASPTLNYTPISYRNVRAFRLSTEYARTVGNSLFTFTPFVRWNEMELLANWSLTFDPNVYTTGHRSVGFLMKGRRNFVPLRGRAIAGVDVDHSPGFREESQITVERDGRTFTGYALGNPIYDYDVTFRSLSPYIQGEISPIDRLRLVAGLRLDVMRFDYETKLDPVDTGRHRRPANTSISYTHLSPKLGSTLELADEFNLFGIYGHGFRAPSEGQLFRQGQAVNTVDLDPVTVDSYEAGARGTIGGRLSYSATAYTMTKNNDILNFVREDGSTETVNAGRTLHRGVEVGLGADLLPGVRAEVAYSRAKHTYEEWVPVAGSDFGGKELETAPRTLANALLQYSPGFLDGGRVGVEWARVGSYWMDPQNTHRYPGHHLVNVRAAVPVAAGVSVFARVTNVADRRFAESAGYTTARGSEYAPGMPRAIHIGLRRN